MLSDSIMHYEVVNQLKIYWIKLSDIKKKSVFARKVKEYVFKSM